MQPISGGDRNGTSSSEHSKDSNQALRCRSSGVSHDEIAKILIRPRSPRFPMTMILVLSPMPNLLTKSHGIGLAKTSHALSDKSSQMTVLFPVPGAERQKFDLDLFSGGYEPRVRPRHELCGMTSSSDVIG